MPTLSSAEIFVHIIYELHYTRLLSTAVAYRIRSIKKLFAGWKKDILKMRSEWLQWIQPLKLREMILLTNSVYIYVIGS